MDDILNSIAKFQVIGSSEDNGNTATIESRIQRRLLELYNGNAISESVYKQIWLSASQRPRMHGLPKGYQKDIPLCPILSMIGSVQHKLAKFLINLFQPVLQLFTSNCAKDSFSFAAKIQELEIDPSDIFICSFDIYSLFTNVLLTETIQIRANTLSISETIPPDFPKDTKFLLN